MITVKEIYQVFAAVVPLYVALILAYGSVRWWKIFTPEQSSGINRFVAVFAVPLLSFQFIASNNPYTMNLRFVAADSLQKVVILVALFLWSTFTKWGSIDWSITLFSLSTLPNTLILGIPLLKAMYGDYTASLMVEIVVLQSAIWNTILLSMFEYRGARQLILEQFPETAGAISSLRVDSDVNSLNGREPLQAEAEIGEDGKLKVFVRSMSRNSESSIGSSLNKSCSTPRSASNLTGVEIYPISSYREPKPRGSSFDEKLLRTHKERSWRSKSCHNDVFNGGFVSSYSPLKPMFSGSKSGGGDGDGDGGGESRKDLNMFACRSNGSKASSCDVGGRDVVNTSVPSVDFGTTQPSKAVHNPHQTLPSRGVYETINMDPSLKASIERNHEAEEGIKFPVPGSQNEAESNANRRQQMTPLRVMARLIIIMVWRNLIRNPNTYASVLGIIWSLISFRWNLKMPSIIEGSIAILSKTGLGMSMFSLGLFMALQARIITCGKTFAALSMVMKFLVGPAVIAATAKAVGIRGVFYQIAIVQASLPVGIVPFVFANEYNLHADILNTAVIFGIVVSLPITIIYYVLLGL